MTTYSLVVAIQAEADLRDATAEEWKVFDATGMHPPSGTPGFDEFMFSTGRVHDYSRAAGTYVEVENVGEIYQFNPRQQTIDTPDGPLGWPDPSHDFYQSLHMNAVPRVGRPIVLLAVGGGNQEFDHWDAESSICIGQGARCEVPEPPEDMKYTTYAKAVFRKKSEDIRLGRFEELTSLDRAAPRFREPGN